MNRRGAETQRGKGRGGNRKERTVENEGNKKREGAGTLKVPIPSLFLPSLCLLCVSAVNPV